MMLWIGILFALVCMVLAVKLRFFETWTIFFDAIIASYLALFLGPDLSNNFAIVGDASLNQVIVIALTGIASFLLLYLIAYYLFLSQFTIKFPQLLDTAGSCILGLLTGMIAWGMIVLLILAGPMAESSWVQKMGLDSKDPLKNTKSIRFFCNNIHGLVGQSDISTGQVIEKLLGSTKKEPVAKKRPADHEERKQEEIEKLPTRPDEVLGPPPEPEFETFIDEPNTDATTP